MFWIASKYAFPKLESLKSLNSKLVFGELTKAETKLKRVDFGKVAEAHDWEFRRLGPNLSNLREIIERSYSGSTKSMLVHMRVDKNIEIGQNPRLLGLRATGDKTYL